MAKSAKPKRRSRKPVVHGKKGLKQFGKKNGRWRGGRSKTFRRRVTKAKPGQIVHHKNKNKSDNKPSNFKKMSPGDHNRAHPEKSKKGNQAKRRGKKK